ncbi:MAG: fibronectin type III domain-containing protein [Clostridia bacterium]|nr:fibronectin type III domain-containing protein [Clostridia bacterium]
MKKRAFAMLLSLMLMLSAVPFFGFTASAAVKHTIEEAFSWLDSQVGKQLNPDGIYPGECVDLVLAYYDYLTGNHSGVSGNANQYVSNKVPAGFKRIKGAVPQPGDICVQTGGKYGHVWIQGYGNVTYHSSYNSVKKVQKITKKFTTNQYYGVIRPTFKPSVYSLNVNTVVDGTTYENGTDGITFSVKLNGSASALNVKDYQSANLGSGLTYEICDIKYPDKYVLTGAMNVKGAYTAAISGVTVCNISLVTPKAVKAAELGLNRYEVFNDSTTYDCAKEYAEKHNGHLVSITSKEENDFVYSLIKEYIVGVNKPYCYWTGASDEENEGSWQWTDGSALSYSNWEAGEPSNSSGCENYAVIKSDTGLWNDLQHYSSAKIKGFIVEYEHEHTLDSGKLVKPAVFGKAGAKAYTCSVCGTVVKTVAIAYPKTVTLSAKSFVYTGKEIKPAVTVKDSKGKTIAATNYTVKYTNNKSVGTGKVTVTLKGNYSGSKVLTFTITPKQVTGLKAATVKTTSIALSWAKVTGAKYYKVEQSTDGKKWTAVKTVGTNALTVSKLKAGTKYQFRVTALDSTKKIAGAKSAVLKTGTLTAAPAVTLKSAKSKTATASWKKVTGASKYIVYKSTNGKKWTKVTTTTKLTYTLTKLTGGKKIYVKVYAVNAYGKNSAASTVKSVTVKK